jgi:hypothetical protein
LKRAGQRGTDRLTLLHKLVGLVWVVSAAGVLVLTLPGLRDDQVAWNLVLSIGRVASVASVLTLVLAIVYGLFTIWGFLGSRWLLAKWALYLVAVAASGYLIRAAREQDATVVVLLAVVQIAALVPAGALGWSLTRARNAGRLPRRMS